jgi:hypothetical protein
MVRDIRLLCFLLAASLVFEGAARAEPPAPAVTVHIVNTANNTLAVTTIEPRLSWPLILQRSGAVDESMPDAIYMARLEYAAIADLLARRDAARPDVGLSIFANDIGGREVITTRSKETFNVRTESPVYEDLAAEFALLFLRRFLAGKAAGLAMLESRLEMLGRLNPLGIAYTVYGFNNLKITQPAAPPPHA